MGRGLLIRVNCLIKVNCLRDGCERMNLLRNWVIVVFDDKDVIINYNV